MQLQFSRLQVGSTLELLENRECMWASMETPKMPPSTKLSLNDWNSSSDHSAAFRQNLGRHLYFSCPGTEVEGHTPLIVKELPHYIGEYRAIGPHESGLLRLA